MRKVLTSKHVVQYCSCGAPVALWWYLSENVRGLGMHLSGWASMHGSQDVLLSCLQLGIRSVILRASAFQLYTYSFAYWATSLAGIDQDVPRTQHTAVLLIQIPLPALVKTVMYV